MIHGIPRPPLEQVQYTIDYNLGVAMGIIFGIIIFYRFMQLYYIYLKQALKDKAKGH